MINKIGEPRVEGVADFLQSELEDTKSYHQLITTFTNSEKINAFFFC